MSPDEKPVNASPRADGEKSPAELRAEIDQTREELGDTVEALAEKTDFKARARQNPKPLAVAGGALVIFILWRALRS
jgi:hypothetical protein